MSIREYLTGGLPCFGGQSKQPKTKRNGAKSDAPLPIAAQPAKSPAATKMDESIGKMESSNKKSASSASSSIDAVMGNSQLSRLPNSKAKKRMNRARAEEQRRRIVFREFLLRFLCCCCLGRKTRNLPQRTRTAKKARNNKQKFVCDESAPVQHFDNPVMKSPIQSPKIADNTLNMELMNMRTEIDSIKDPPLESFVEDHLKTLNDFELLKGTNDESNKKQIPFDDMTNLTLKPFRGEENFLSSVENIEKPPDEKVTEESLGMLSQEFLQLSLQDPGLKTPDVKSDDYNTPNKELDFEDDQEEYFDCEDIPSNIYETLFASDPQEATDAVRACNSFDLSGESPKNKITTPDMPSSIDESDDGQQKAEQEVLEPLKEKAEETTKALPENTKQRARRVGAFVRSIQPFYLGPNIDPRVAADMETSVRQQYNFNRTGNDEEVYELCVKHLKEFGVGSYGGGGIYEDTDIED